MISNTENSKKYFQCPLTNAMNVIGGKWKIVILGHLLKKEKRFGELNRSIQGVSQKMLTQQLRELEKDGIVHREIYKEIPENRIFIRISQLDIGIRKKEEGLWLAATIHQ